ncbi:MAG TPA: hypothetical protein VEJ16_03260 [Alphaproteobacteria bacterium]|nr:hypothetical protein [Alphaproteobacteria bacterium]
MRVRDTDTLIDVHFQDEGEMESGVVLMLEFERRNAIFGPAQWIGVVDGRVDPLRRLAAGALAKLTKPNRFDVLARALSRLSEEECRGIMDDAAKRRSNG